MMPHEIRRTQFSQRLRGYDESEVKAFCESVAAQVQRQLDERASLRAEIDRLRGMADNEDVKERAVALFSQAQTVADQLISEAVEHAQDLMLAARAQQREILGRVRDTAQNLSPAPVPEPARSGSDADLNHVQTYAQIAAVQLRAVIDALSEEVDKLDQAVGSDPATPLPAAPRTHHTDAGVRTHPDANNADEPIWASLMPSQTVRDPGW